MVHNYIKDEIADEWFIRCGEFQRKFQTTARAYKEEGKCPLCKGDVKTEFAIRKRTSEEFQRRKDMQEKQRRLNTLEGYM